MFDTRMREKTSGSSRTTPRHAPFESPNCRVPRCTYFFIKELYDETFPPNALAQPEMNTTAQLEERVRQSKVTADGSILKLILQEGKSSHKVLASAWPKGSKARIHYSSFSFTKPQQLQEAGGEHHHSVCGYNTFYS